MKDLGYLIVTHIPFARREGAAVTDGLWARDLEGLRDSMGPVRVAAPELAADAALDTWGPSVGRVAADDGIEFVGLPVFASRRDLWQWPRARRILRNAVSRAAVVHTSNYFRPYTGLYYAHDFAVRSGRKTVFVIAEDFHDMLEWEWVRMAQGPWQRWRRARELAALDNRVRRAASSATLTMIHTPAAVARYRLAARNSVAIRQPGHEEDDVISAAALEARCAEAFAGQPLTLVAACRHKPLKGLDLLLSAVALLRQREVAVKLQLYGQGESSGSLEALARRLGVADRVAFCGSLPPGPQIYGAISRGHIFAMPHRTSDFGRAFFDAMSGGTPVVAFETPASAQTVRHEVDGLLAACDDVEALAAAIERFHCDRPLLVRCSRAARLRALSNTRKIWFDLRAGWTRALLEEPQ